MPVKIIEINGSGITVHNDSGILLESPACATADGKQVLLGDEARTKARLKPTETNTYFWDQLAMEPLPKPFLNARHHADIAYWHLKHVWERINTDCNEVVIALPGSFSDVQLGLVLGISQSLEIPVMGLIDAALAASDSNASQTPTQLHLDIQLHRTVLTRLALKSELSRVGIRQRVGTGLASLNQIWIDAIRDHFLRLTRFDPMHEAQTEQQLYTNLQDWLLRLTQEEMLSLEISFKDKIYGITLNREDFIRSAAEGYGQILELIEKRDKNDESVEIHLSHRLWSLPGLTEGLSGMGISNPVVKLDPQAIARTVKRRYALICKSAEPMHFITLLPRPVTKRAIREQNALRSIPTHIVYRSQAYPIGEHPIVLGAETTSHPASLRLRGPLNGVSQRHCSIYTRENRVWIEDHSTYGTFLNEQKIQGQTLLHTGDKVRIGTPGEVLLLIAEVNPNAS